jgi:WxL interacting protein linking bacterial and host surfaces
VQQKRNPFRCGWLPFTMTLLAAVVVTAGSGAAATGEQASFSLQPSPPRSPGYFVFPAKRGAEIAGTVQLANVGTTTGTAMLYPVDATTADRGGVAYLARARPRRDVGQWLHLAASRVSLKPHEQALVPFTVSVPANGRPGDHVGGIVAEDAAEKTSSHRTGEKQFQIRVRHLTVVAVEVRLPGTSKVAVRPIGLQAGKWGSYQTLQLGLRNTGTLIIKPTGTLLVFGAHHTLVQRAKLQIDTFLPKTSIQYTIFLKGQKLPGGTYTASLTLHYGANSSTLWHTTFTITSLRAGGSVKG